MQIIVEKLTNLGLARLACQFTAEHSGERSEVRLLRSGYTTRQ